jgi:hypothetical protein
MLPARLRERKERLQRAFNGLSGTAEIVRSSEAFRDGEPVIEFTHSVRVARAGVRLVVWEQFRRIESEPQLHAFSYHVAEETDVAAANPFFRFECHPSTADPENADEVFISPYQTEPHFHPDNTVNPPIRKLHFPFHRAERKAVVFALIQWIRVDLVRRFF